MPVPDFQSMMLPLLQQLADGKEHSIHEILDKLARVFSLTEEEENELIPSGKQTTFYNRVGWARTYLAKSGLIEIPRRSYWKISDRGKEVLMSKPARIDMKFLVRYPEFVEFREKEGTRRKSHQGEDSEETLPVSSKTPEEVLDYAYQEIRDNLAQEVLALVKNTTPAFFERSVVELLVKMGYGGSRQDAARAVGHTGDEGIDGIIDEDRLGLDAIYIQAKNGIHLLEGQRSKNL